MLMVKVMMFVSTLQVFFGPDFVLRGGRERRRRVVFGDGVVIGVRQWSWVCCGRGVREAAVAGGRGFGLFGRDYCMGHY